MAGSSHEIDGDTRKDTIITKTGDNMIPDALTGYQPKLNDACHQVPGALAGYSQNQLIILRLKVVWELDPIHCSCSGKGKTRYFWQKEINYSGADKIPLVFLYGTSLNL